MQIRQIKCKSLLNRTALPADYAVNPYLGCSHACVYCYARYMVKFASKPGRWGGFVEVKENAFSVLLGELKRKQRGSVYFSSATDAYQPVEEKTKLTRGLLELLSELRFPVTVQTKSTLVLRDADILKKAGAEVGFSITTLDDEAGAIFEPGASLPSERVKALEELKRSGIKTFCMTAPVLPGITEIPAIRERLSGIADYFIEDALNIKCGNWPGIERAVKKHYPALLPGFGERKKRAF